MDPKSSKRFVIIGRRGRGKSSLLNLLVDGANWSGRAAEVSHNGGSAKTNTDAKKGVVEPLWEFVDTTGIDDSDRTKLKDTLVQELESVAKAAGPAGLDGVLYVLPHGRTDPTDDMVARFLLSVLYNKVPSAMIAVVITNSPQDELKSADPAEDFRQMLSTGDGANPGLATFLLERCENKVCFVANADPSRETLLPTTPLRQKSLESVIALLRQMSGKVTSKDLQKVSR